MTKAIPKEKKCKKVKWLSEFLQIANERTEMKAKSERKSYSQLNADFHRVARRNKKAFWNEQRKGIEEKKKIEQERLEISSRTLEIPGNISCKDGYNKRQKQQDLREAEDK